MGVRHIIVVAVCGVVLGVALLVAGAPGAGVGRVMAQAGPEASGQTPSSAQAYSLPPEKLKKAEGLETTRTILYFGDALWGLAVLWLLLVTGAAARMAAWAERVFHKRWLQGLFFFAVLIVILTLTELPVGAIAQSISRSYGISVQSWGSWLLDGAKALGLTLAIGSPVLLLFNWIVRVAPRSYWVWGWMVAVVLMVFGAFIEPLGEPIFNKYEPLQKTNPALVAQLEKVVARTGTNIPPERMYLMRASEKTNGLNAYVSGLGATKRVVVWDTTAGRVPDDEVMFIFGHESGHYVLNHIPKLMAGGAVFLFFLFWAGAGFAGWVVRRFGGRWELADRNDGGRPLTALATRTGFVVLLLTVSVANVVLEPVGNAYSRHFEHEADVYGQEAVHGLVADPQETAVSAFNHLGAAWLEAPDPNSFVVFWTYNHPSIQSRATFAREYDPWANGGRGEFFGK